jgi:hypothetical protein
VAKICARLPQITTLESDMPSVYRPLLWFAIPCAVVGVWKGSFWAFDYFGCTSGFKSGLPTCYAGPVNITALRDIGWFCMVLWFPSLLVCIVLAGLGMQRRLPVALLERLTVTHRDATSLTAKAVSIWITVTAVGVASVLVAFYPKAPSSVTGWLALALPWVPLWLLGSWVQMKRQAR